MQGQTLNAVDLNNAFSKKQDFSPTLNSRLISVMDYCTATQVAIDITSCAQAALNAAAASNVSYGGKLVFFPAQFSPYVLLGTLTISGSFVGIIGEGAQTSYIQCANGSADCVQLGQVSGSATRDQSIRDMGIVGSSKTGGSIVHIFNTFNVLIQRNEFDKACRGNDIETKTNNITIRDTNIAANQSCTDYGIYWHAPGDGSSRADVLVLNNVVISGTYATGGTGIQWQGLANTLLCSHLRILTMQYGIRIQNPTNSVSNYPAFMNCFDMELEGFKSRALSIEAGNEFKITSSDMTNSSGASGQGSADDYAVFIGADASFSITRGVQITNSRIGASRNSGLQNNARGTQLSNNQFYSTSLEGSNLHPVIENTATSIDTMITNILCEDFGGAALASNCIHNDSGASYLIVNGIDSRFVNGSAITDAGSTNVSYRAILEPTGQIWSAETITTVANLPGCNAVREGARYYVTDQNTAVSYRGAVTGLGTTRQAVLCSNSSWIQD